MASDLVVCGTATCAVVILSEHKKMALNLESIFLKNENSKIAQVLQISFG